jgi:hypothetical protein
LVDQNIGYVLICFVTVFCLLGCFVILGLGIFGKYEIADARTIYLQKPGYMSLPKDIVVNHPSINHHKFSSVGYLSDMVRINFRRSNIVLLRFAREYRQNRWQSPFWNWWNLIFNQRIANSKRVYFDIFDLGRGFPAIRYDKRNFMRLRMWGVVWFECDANPGPFDRANVPFGNISLTMDGTKLAVRNASINDTSQKNEILRNEILYFKNAHFIFGGLGMVVAAVLLGIKSFILMGNSRFRLGLLCLFGYLSVAWLALWTLLTIVGCGHVA